jgi:hypothetical protein
MLYMFGFDRVAVLVGDLYFVDPEPIEGQQSPEHGVRLELRLLDRGPLRGTIYAAQPIEVGQPVWRADFLESVDGTPGSYDRTHHHPAFSGWDPGDRVFVRELSADPLGWLAGKLSDLNALLTEAGFPEDTAGPDEAAALRHAAPEIIEATGRLLDRVRAGELGNPPGDRTLALAGAQPRADGEPVSVRSGWL